MTVAKFKSVLNSLGLSTVSGWFRFPEEATMLCLANDVKEYISQTNLYKLDETNGCLLVSRDHDTTETISGTYAENDIYNLEYIDYIVSSSFSGPMQSFYTKTFQ